LKTTGKFLLITPLSQNTNKIHFPIKENAVEENLRSFNKYCPKKR